MARLVSWLRALADSVITLVGRPAGTIMEVEMPWFPDCVAAVELARRQTRAAGRPDPVAQYFTALDKGDSHALEAVWPGEVVIYDPRAGEIRGHKQSPNELPQLAECLPEINRPVLIIAGRRDRVVPLMNAEFLDERLPNGKLVVEAGHFVWEERAGEYASLIADWVVEGGDAEVWYFFAAERRKVTKLPLPLRPTARRHVGRPRP